MPFLPGSGSDLSPAPTAYLPVGPPLQSTLNPAIVNPLSESGRQTRTWAQLRLEAAVGGQGRLPAGGSDTLPRNGGSNGGVRGRNGCGGGKEGGRSAGSKRATARQLEPPSSLAVDETETETEDERDDGYGQPSHLPMPQRLPAPPRANPAERAIPADRTKLRTLGQRHQPVTLKPVTHRSAAFEAMQLKYEDPPAGGYRAMYRTSLTELQARYSPTPPHARGASRSGCGPSGYDHLDARLEGDAAADNYGA